MEVPHVFVGCELLVRRGDGILLGVRKNCFGAGSWGLPGGHLMPRERLVDAACREAEEELGFNLTPKELKLVSLVDKCPPDGAHHVHATFELRNPKQEPRLMEPERCEKWRYFPLDALPDNLFEPHRPIIENYRAGRLYVY